MTAIGAAAHQQPSPPVFGSTVFFGPNGLRAFWRLLAFLTLAYFFTLFFYVVPRFLGLNPPESANPWQVLLDDGSLFFGALFAAVLMGLAENRSIAFYGLPWRGAFGKGFVKGIVWGFVALTTVMLSITIAGGFSFGSLALRGSPIVTNGALWAVAFLAVGFCEEFLSRGYALYTLTTGMGFWPSAVLLSLFFGGIHLKNIGEDWTGVLAVAVVGLFFCLTVRRTGNLWFAVGMHAAWDFAESFIYSCPDSGIVVTGHLLNSSFQGPRWLTGGSAGPEGSVLAFVVIGALFVLFNRLYPEVHYPGASGSGIAKVDGPEPDISGPAGGNRQQRTDTGRPAPED